MHELYQNDDTKGQKGRNMIILVIVTKPEKKNGMNQGRST